MNGYANWKSPASCLAAAALLMALMVPVERAIIRRRSEVAPAAGGDQWTVLMSALGPLKPVAVDLLWLRAVQMQQEGRLYEVHMQYALITRLQPRLPVVWKFLTHNVFINIPAIYVEGRDRIDWMAEGVRLMDEGIRYNPDSYVLYFNKAELYMIAMGKHVMERNPYLWAYMAQNARRIDPALDVPDADLRTRVGRFKWRGHFYRVTLGFVQQARVRADARRNPRIRSLLVRQMAVMQYRIGESMLIVDPPKAHGELWRVVEMFLQHLQAEPGDTLAATGLRARLKDIIYLYSRPFLNVPEKERQTYIDKYMTELKKRFPEERNRSAADVIREMERIARGLQ